MRQTLASICLWALALATLTVFVALASTAQAGDLRVVAEDVRSGKGVVIFAIHREGEPFPDQNSPYAGGFRQADKGLVSMTFGNLPSGRYALVVVHDENLDRELDTNFVGVPTEGFGFSNNAMGTLRPPSFNKASFEIKTDGEVTQSIRLIYIIAAS